MTQCDAAHAKDWAGNFQLFGRFLRRLFRCAFLVFARADGATRTRPARIARSAPMGSCGVGCQPFSAALPMGVTFPNAIAFADPLVHIVANDEARSTI